jgi:myotubularin-related protein 1/2
MEQNLRKFPVLIHCPTGMDGSSVLSSLVQIVSDPFYRTFAGFRALIYKEWIWMMHNFVGRFGLMLQKENSEPVIGQVISTDLRQSQQQMQNWPNVNNCKQYCPHFILFLDCVNQLIQMNPHLFEFTTYFLVNIAFNCFTSRFYELVFPIYTVEQGRNHRIDDQTQLVSIFQAQDKHNRLYSNQFYVKRDKNHIEFDKTRISVWKEYFCRYDDGKKEQLSKQILTAERERLATKTVKEHQLDLEEDIRRMVA